MAWTERYVRADAAGGGDGTTNTNSGANGAWTLAEGITNEVAGMRLNMLAGTYASTTTTRTFAAIGTTTAPIWWRGFKTSIGDQDANNVAVAGTDIPSLTFTTGQMVISGAHHIFSSMDISGACTTTNGQLAVTGTGCLLYGLRATNTAANANSRAIGCSSGGTSVSIVRCYLKATSSANVLALNGGNAYVHGCVLTGGNIGASLQAGTQSITYCIIDSPAGDAILVGGVACIIVGNSIYAPTGNGINYTSVTLSLVANNYFENVNQASKAAINNTSGTNTNLIRAVANTYYNCTANTSGLGDSPLIFDNGTLGSAGFVAPGSQNFALNSVAKALGFPGLLENTSAYQGYLDPGAVQRQEPAAGGGPFGGFISMP